MAGKADNTIVIKPGRQYSPRIIQNVLNRINELKGLSQPQLARISRSEVRFWGPNEFVISEGTENLDQMVIILAGKVFIRKTVDRGGQGGSEQMAEIPGPTIVGENSFFTGLERSAGVLAKDRIPGIILGKDDFMRLISLDKLSTMNFLRNIATENLHRAERTAVLYLNTLQLVLNQASISHYSNTETLNEFREALRKKDIDIQQMRDLVREILMFIRELNNSLENLYTYAHLPAINAVAVDFKTFNIDKDHILFETFKALTEELYMTQQLVPIESINLKDSILNAVISTLDKDISEVGYPTIIDRASKALNTFIDMHEQMGFEIRMTQPAQSELPLEEEKSTVDLLWD